MTVLAWVLIGFFVLQGFQRDSGGAPVTVVTAILGFALAIWIVAA